MMKWLQKEKELLENKLLKLYVKAACSKMASERGDTNFISILIILGIVVVLAAAFIGFKDTIINAVNGMIDKNIGQITKEAGGVITG